MDLEKELAMQEYDEVCRCVGKLVLDFHADMKAYTAKAQKAIEEFKGIISEKDKLIKQLEKEIESLKVNKNG
jgi:hypothetical protein